MNKLSESEFVFERCIGCELDCPYVNRGLDPWLMDFAAALSLAREGVRSPLFQWCPRNNASSRGVNVDLLQASHE